MIILLVPEANLVYVQVVEVPNVSWEDIGGLENVKRELQEVFCPCTVVWLLNCLHFFKKTLNLADCSISSGASREIREVWHVSLKGCSVLRPSWLWKDFVGQGDC